MATKKTFNFIIDGGKATAGPPLGPSLGPLGVNVPMIVDRINELTKEFAGMRVPVKVTVDVDTKEFEVEIGIPTTSALIAKEAKIEKGSSNPGREYVGNLAFDQVIKIAKILKRKVKVGSFKGLILQVIGTCVSMGVKVDNKPPKEVTRLVKEGIYDEKIKE
ncbi:50S ribosomal protein L11 [Candidatus Geothermarchaeota archaeon]|nr:MAG: 50S ribosomal protein L11 [Candidatus Geothermarchaeota archaeon]